MKSFITTTKVLLCFCVIYYVVSAIVISAFLSSFVFQRVEIRATFQDRKDEFFSHDSSVIDRIYGEQINEKCIIFFPGRQGGIYHYQDTLFPTFVQSGYTVHALSYPGYEGAKGSTSLAEITDILANAIEQVTSIHNCDDKHLVYIGRSLGASIALAVAKEIPPTLIIIDSLGESLTSALQHRLRQQWYLRPLEILPLQYLVNDIDSVDLITKTYPVPIKVFQGTQDKQTPIDDLSAIQYLNHVELIPIAGATHATTAEESLHLYQRYLSAL